MPSPILPPIGPDLRQWGRQLSAYLQGNLAKLGFKTSEDNASENGVILWDNEDAYPVVSDNNEFKEIVVRQSVPSANTGATGDKAGLIAWDTSYIYICVDDYDGTTAIWKRVALATW